MPTTDQTLQVTVRCGHCDHVLATYPITPLEKDGTFAKYKWQHLFCSACKKTMGPKIAVVEAPAIPVIDDVVDPLTPAGA